MKNTLLKLCITTLFITLLINCDKKLNAESTGKLFKSFLAKDILGESSTDGSVNRGAIAYSLGSNGGYVLKDDKVQTFNN